MSAKRFVLACSAVGALLTAAPAQSPTPEPLPAPRPVPMALPEVPIRDHRITLSRFLDGTDAETRNMVRQRQSDNTSERQVVVRALCIRVPLGWVESLGRVLADPSDATDGEPNSGPWTLTPREARLLAAVTAAGPMVDVLSRPALTLTDDQTGFFQVGQQMPLVSALRVETKNGTDVYTAQVATADIGITLRLTPKIAADGRSVRLRADAQLRDLNGPVLPVVPVGLVTDQGVVARNPKAPVHQVGTVVNVQTVQTTVELPTGGTAIVCSTDAEIGPGRVVWLLTPHIVGSQPAPTPTGK